MAPDTPRPTGDDSGDASPELLTTTELLLQRVRGGDSEALERLFRRYRGPLQRWAQGRLPAWARDFVDTEDVVQDTLMRTIPHIDAFEKRAVGAFGAYLRTCVRNAIHDAMRRAQRQSGRSELIEDPVDWGPSPVEEAIGMEQLRRYEQALERLSDPEREGVTLRLELGLSYGEIAEHLGKPSPDAARMFVARAVQRLARELQA